jgi:hypothetical protein
MDRVHGLRSMGLQHSETIPTVEFVIHDWDLISWKAIFRSNPGPTSKIGQWRASSGGQQRRRLCLRRCSLGAHRRQASGRSKDQIITGFHPMAPQRGGKIVWLNFKWWRVTVVAGNLEAVWPRLDNGEGDLQCLPNDLDSSYGGGPLWSSWDG